MYKYVCPASTTWRSLARSVSVDAETDATCVNAKGSVQPLDFLGAVDPATFVIILMTAGRIRSRLAQAIRSKD